ncbi:hypothetical protein Tco_1436735, partial [Tanacetum coccineum]
MEVVLLATSELKHVVKAARRWRETGGRCLVGSRGGDADAKAVVVMWCRGYGGLGVEKVASHKSSSGVSSKGSTSIGIPKVFSTSP